MALPIYDNDPREMGVIGHFLAGGEMVAAQLPSHSSWTPEKKRAEIDHYLSYVKKTIWF